MTRGIDNNPLASLPFIYYNSMLDVLLWARILSYCYVAFSFSFRHQSSRLEKAAENDVKAKAPNLIERAKEEIEAIIHHGKSPVHHHIETHGRNDDIDDSTPIDQVKGPSVFQRAKEEVEALVQTIHRKKESSNSVSSPKKEGGFGACIGKGLEKICSFNWGSKRD
ncbi:hypothetical protein POPTR_006G148000v4 [Populus trichocarpa]|uniref:Uncharacterized protein n=1 Tax=Populus trichocarpa TaxID=3694 RepID=A0ACC0SUE3_POPTR|nr:hypothetical protein BDE02_06G132600 [Populus trichocarpa]KAI9392875.1 hypothetical protein POPTR_006G148000v4 [Populus trichocarpa]